MQQNLIQASKVSSKLSTNCDSSSNHRQTDDSELIICPTLRYSNERDKKRFMSEQVLTAQCSDAVVWVTGRTSGLYKVLLKEFRKVHFWETPPTPSRVTHLWN